MTTRLDCRQDVSGKRYVSLELSPGLLMDVFTQLLLVPWQVPGHERDVIQVVRPSVFVFWTIEELDLFDSCGVVRIVRQVSPQVDDATAL